MSYPSMKIKSYNNFSATSYITAEILPNLPPSDKLVEFTEDIYSYLNNLGNLRIIRKFKNYNLRGSKFYFSNNVFTVCDNEPALWNFMQCFENFSSDIKSTIDNMELPIAFALTEVEKKNSLIYTTYGKKSRENQFSSQGWKHCHLLQCSPRNTDFSFLSVDQRMIRLLSPLNHFPFPSSKKFKMVSDYGEDSTFINLVKYYIYNEYLTLENERQAFKTFLTKAGDFFESDNKPADISISFSFPKS